MLSSILSLEGHDGRVWHASWSPDGTKIASCGEDKTIKIWLLYDDFQSFQCIATLEDAQTRTIRCCEWSPSSRMLASASFDGTVIIWSSSDRSFKQWDRIATLEGHESEVKSLSWNSDGNLLATCGRDKKIWIWEKLERNDFEVSSVLDGHSQDVKFVLFHPTAENFLFSTSYDDTIKIWIDDGSGDWYCHMTLIGHSSTVWGLTFDSEGDSFISCSADQSVILWENESKGEGSKNPSKSNWRKVASLRNLHDYPIYSIDWRKMSNTIITGAGDNTLNVLSYSKGEDGFGTLNIKHRHSDAHSGDINCVRWNPSYHPNFNDLLLSASDDGLIKIWRCQDY
jgi:WD40 repeat protein